MDINKRRYIINRGEIYSHGISASTTSNQFNMLESFSVNGNNYEQITTKELSKLNESDYIQRVRDYLTYINIENYGEYGGDLKNDLIDSASYYDPTVEDECELNSNFLVYRFFDGVRVIRIGDVNGEAQYRAFPVGENPDDYSWQRSPTFLDVDLNKRYVFEVRDYFEDKEHCKVQREVSLALLVQSTTFVPENKTIYLNQTSCGTSSIAYFNNGTIEVEPKLNDDEIVSVDYTLFADASGDAESYAEIYCKPSGRESFVSYYCQTSSWGSTTGSFTLRAGDEMCYNLNTIVPDAGSCGCACIDINSVNGGGTTAPLIDFGRCCETRSAYIPREELTVSVTGNTIYSNDYCEKERGEFVFTPAIPQDEDVTLVLDGLADISPVQSDATSSIIIKCKSNNATGFDTIFSRNQSNAQSFTENINAKYGDTLCYELEIETVDGATATSYFDIIDTFCSNGITSSIGSPNGAYIEKSAAATPVTVAMCKQNEECYTGCACGDGFINISPSLSSGQCVRIELDAELYITEDLTYYTSTDDYACAVIYCKRPEDTGYSVKCNMTTTAVGSTCSANIYACAGDRLCYCVSAQVVSTEVARTCLEINNTVGFGGVEGNICSTKCDHCVEGMLNYDTTTVSAIGVNNL